MNHREIIDQIGEVMDKDNKAIVLLGPRQVGKTTIMKIMIKNWPKSLFLDLDLISNRDIFKDDRSVLFYLKANGYKENSKKMFYFFVDEFQNIELSTLIFKNLIDNFDNIKIIASGSSSLKIKNLVKESLSGRAYVYNIYPLSFREFLSFKKQKVLTDILTENNIPDHYVKELNKYLCEFLIFGGYPEVVLNDTVEGKYKILENIFQFYLEKDIRSLLEIRNIDNFSNLLRYLSLTLGNLLKVNHISNEIGLNNITLNNYLSVLSDTFLVYRLQPFFSNKINSLKKTPKIYLVDNGFRNYLINNFQDIDLRIDKGQLVENFVFTEIIKNKSLISDVYFWRDKNQNEIDFVYSKNGENILIEVKSNKAQKYNKNAIKIFKDNVGAKKTLVLNFDSQSQSEMAEFDLLANFAYKYL